ncbi:MAG: Fe-S cluster assembly protein SufB [Candidatus Calescibacterium sp.]|nr:Fe-S cluster assembly protein SufB [Candidatus Calescibacterium sp.]MCX7734554.1 Fe-S cluster assembly protein SufB [bacterium]MDW8087622.1 Fe-S cluster assembly protein SufB [Candidatus Calescibacterium sp.]
MTETKKELNKGNKETAENLNFDYSRYDFKMPELYEFKTKKGLSEEVIKQISYMKEEPQWMTEFRLKSYEIFRKKDIPKWGPDLSEIKFDEYHYYIKPTDKKGHSWDEVPQYIKDAFERLGIPEAERKFLAGVGAMYESEVVYHKIREDLEKMGVIFVDTDTAVKKYPDLVKKYFGKVVPPTDNKFAALNSAVWSGGSFIYVPPGVKVDRPLQAYFRINAQNVGQFERTLIIADEGAEVTYVEGCSAPVYSSDSLHSAVVEIVALPYSKVQYITIQNWSKNVFNLVTKRAVAYKGATVIWIDGNIGSKVTMKYPGVYLLEPESRAEIISVAYAGRGQIQDAGAKVIHAAPYTSSVITSKSVSKFGGLTTYRGLVKVVEGAKKSSVSVTCDALILDEYSRSNTLPHMEILEDDVTISHEASVGRISEEIIFYLMTRGLKEPEALALIVRGFMDPFVKTLPMEYAVEMNRLIELEMEGAVG